jgi:GT2 family glycosyltransferase
MYAAFCRAPTIRCNATFLPLVNELQTELARRVRSVRLGVRVSSRRLPPGHLSETGYVEGRNIVLSSRTPSLLMRASSTQNWFCRWTSLGSSYRPFIYGNALLSKSSAVSVIIANYNYGRFLREAVEPVLSQTVPPDELILIDDCSNDNSREIAEPFRGQVRLIFNERNLGIVANFNKAVSLTSGDFVAFLGADNRMRSDYVERCKGALDLDPSAAIAYTDMIIFGPLARDLAEKVGARLTGTTAPQNPPVYLWQFTEPTAEALADLPQANFIHGSSMYRRAAFDEVGGYQKSGGPEDHHLFTRMVQAGWRVCRVPHPLIEYRQHSLSQANTVLNQRLSTA